MKINIKATNVELTPAITEYLDKRLQPIERLLGDDDGAKIYVEVGKTTNHHKTGEFFKAEFNLMTKGQNFYIVSEERDITTAIDTAKDKLYSDLTRSKDKRVHVVRKGALKVKNFLKGLWPWGKNGS